MANVSYTIRIVGGGSGGGKGKSKVEKKETSVTGLGSEIMNSFKSKGMGMASKFAGIATKAGYLAPVAIAAAALNEADNFRISKIGITTGNYTYQAYQEDMKNLIVGYVINPLSSFTDLLTQWKTRELTYAKMDVDRVPTREFNIRAGSMGNRAPRNQ
jgi:hypothetical protein